ALFGRDLAVSVLAPAMAAPRTGVQARERLANALEHQLVVHRLLLLAIAPLESAADHRARAGRRGARDGMGRRGADRGGRARRCGGGGSGLGGGDTGALFTCARHLLLVLAGQLLLDRRRALRD